MIIGEQLGISGIKTISDRRISPTRRAFWMILLLSMFSIMIWQFINRIKTYMLNPLAVNIEMQYEKFVQFPKILICNENHNTVSGSYSLNVNPWNDNQLQFMKDYSTYFSALAKTSNTSMTNYYLAKMNATYGKLLNTVFSEKEQKLYLEVVSHKLNNMLKSCKWLDLTCSENDFLPVENFKDLHECYAFNANESDPLFTTLPGNRGGLRLLLDSQQYEYVSSSTLSAGFTVSVVDDIENANLNMAFHVSAGKCL